MLLTRFDCCLVGAIVIVVTMFGQSSAQNFSSTTISKPIISSQQVPLYAALIHKYVKVLAAVYFGEVGGRGALSHRNSIPIRDLDNCIAISIGNIKF